MKVVFFTIATLASQLKKVIQHITTRNLILLYVIVTIVASVIKISLGKEKFNNFLIFKNSFINLFHQQPIYILHPDQYFDFFKYTPAFAALMFPFSFIPDGAGAVLWNLLNVFVFVGAIKSLKLPENQTVFILAFCFVEQLTSVQNFQSNLLVAGIMIYVFSFFEKEKFAHAAVLAAAALYIKLFGAFIALAFVFYKNKIKFVAASITAAILFFLLPVLLTDFYYVTNQYTEWFNLLRNDPPGTLNYSVHTFFNALFSIQLDPILYTLPGFILLLASFAAFGQYQNKEYRLLMLCNILLWTVIFNHKAESPTFIIAVAGMAILFSYHLQNPRWIYFMILAFILTSLSSTDLFPRVVREEFFKPLRLKALPAIVMWIFIQVEIFRALFGNKQISLAEPTLPDKK